jgi:hypothetical protein
MVTISNAILFAVILAALASIVTGFTVDTVKRWYGQAVEDDLKVTIENLENQLADHSLIIVELFNSQDDNYVSHHEFNYVVDAFQFISTRHAIYDIRVTVRGDTHDDITLMIMNQKNI